MTKCQQTFHKSLSLNGKRKCSWELLRALDTQFFVVHPCQKQSAPEPYLNVGELSTELLIISYRSHSDSGAFSSSSFGFARRWIFIWQRIALLQCDGTFENFLNSTNYCNAHFIVQKHLSTTPHASAAYFAVELGIGVRISWDGPPASSSRIIFCLGMYRHGQTNSCRFEILPARFHPILCIDPQAGSIQRIGWKQAGRIQILPTDTKFVRAYYIPNKYYPAGCAGLHWDYAKFCKISYKHEGGGQVFLDDEVALQYYRVQIFRRFHSIGAEQSSAPQ